MLALRRNYLIEQLGVPATLTSRGSPQATSAPQSRASGINGSWLLAVVATQSVVTLGALLTPHAAAASSSERAAYRKRRISRCSRTRRQNLSGCRERSGGSVPAASEATAAPKAAAKSAGAKKAPGKKTAKKKKKTAARKSKAAGQGREAAGNAPGKDGGEPPGQRRRHHRRSRPCAWCRSFRPRLPCIPRCARRSRCRDRRRLPASIPSGRPPGRSRRDPGARRGQGQ
mgnify:CR=1 FL=1